MPPVRWSVDPVTVVNEFVERHRRPKFGGLILHGVWAVDSLHYLAELDAEDDLTSETVRGYPPDRLDVAHVRWATATCITALDLCAAGLGRVLCGHNKSKELSVADFTPRDKSSDADGRRDMLPPNARAWLDDLLADDDFRKVKATRNVLTHGQIRRHFKMPRERLDVQVGDVRLTVPELVALSRDTAERHVGRLLESLPAI